MLYVVFLCASAYHFIITNRQLHVLRATMNAFVDLQQ
jgi:hypothetical protein